MFPSRLFIRNTDFNKRLTVLLSPSGMHNDNFCTEQNQTQFLFKTTLSKRLYANSGWKLIPQSQQECHAGSSGHISRGIWGSPQLTAAVTSPHCSGNTHNSTVAVGPNQPRVSLSFHPVFVTTRNYLLMAKPTSHTLGEPCSQICTLARGLGKSPARRISPAVGCAPQAPPQHCCAHASTLKAALPPVKPKGSEAPSQAVLLICRP